jgi:hypothetical protein
LQSIHWLVLGEGQPWRFRVRVGPLPAPTKMNGSKGHCPWRGSKGQRPLVGGRGETPSLPTQCAPVALFAGRGRLRQP